MKIVLFITIALSIIAIVKSECNSSNNINGCRCTLAYNGRMHFYCQNPRDIENTIKMLNPENLPIHIHLTELKMDVIAEGFLEDFQVVNIHIAHGNFNRLPSNFLWNSRHLVEVIHLEETMLEELPDISYMTKLRIIEIRGPKTNIKVISKESMEKMPISLKTITLYKINTQTIEKGAFKGLGNLSSLVIGSINISAWPSDTLPDSIFLVSLRGNKFERIPPAENFKDLPKLKHLDFSNNKIDDLLEEDSDIIKMDINIDLNGNPLQCSCKMSWVPKFLKDGNRLLKAGNYPCKKFAEGLVINQLKESNFVDC